MKQVREIQLPERMVAADLMTDEQFFGYAPDDRKAELINGVLILPSPAADPHEDLNGFLLSVIRTFVEERDLGVVRGAKTPVHLGVGHNYEPDVLFVARSRAGIVEHDGVFGAPDLVIEILSPGTEHLDRGIKRQTYAQAGVRELWLLSSESARKSAFYQRQARGGLAAMKPQEGVLRSIAVPGLWLKFEWLWPPEGRLPRVRLVLDELGVL